MRVCNSCGVLCQPVNRGGECEACNRIRPRARSRALTALKRRHEAEFRELYQAELRTSMHERWTA